MDRRLAAGSAVSTRPGKRARRAEPAAEHDQLGIERVREHGERAAPAPPPPRRRAPAYAGSASTSSARSTPAAAASAFPLAMRSTGGAPSVIACPCAPAYGSPSTTRQALAPVPQMTKRKGERSQPAPKRASARAAARTSASSDDRGGSDRGSDVEGRASRPYPRSSAARRARRARRARSRRGASRRRARGRARHSPRAPQPRRARPGWAPDGAPGSGRSRRRRRRQRSSYRRRRCRGHGSCRNRACVLHRLSVSYRAGRRPPQT